MSREKEVRPSFGIKFSILLLMQAFNEGIPEYSKLKQYNNFAIVMKRFLDDHPVPRTNRIQQVEVSALYVKKREREAMWQDVVIIKTFRNFLSYVCYLFDTRKSYA